MITAHFANEAQLKRTIKALLRAGRLDIRKAEKATCEGLRQTLIQQAKENLEVAESLQFRVATR